MSKCKIIDIHTHIYPPAISAAAVKNLGDFYEFTVSGAGTYTDLEATSDAAGVVGCLFLAVATNARQVERVNDYVASVSDSARKSGHTTYAFGCMHQDYPDIDGEVDRAVSLGLRGFKLHPDIQSVNIDDERLFPLYRACEKHHLPVYFHMGDCRPCYRFSEAARLLRIIDRFPDIVAVAAHLGGYTAWDDAPSLAGAPNLYFDTSSALWCLSPGRANELIHLFGTDRVMFGTDYPVMTAAEELPRLYALDLTDDERAAILYGNASRFLGL